jgi:hypothetical protein
MTTYDGENLMGEIIPTNQENCRVYEYDTKERLVLLQNYLIHPDAKKYVRDDGLHSESRIEYDENGLKSISKTSWINKSNYDYDNDEVVFELKQIEEKLYKEDNCWYWHDDSPFVEDVGDILISNDMVYDILLDILPKCAEDDMFLPIRSDGTFAINTSHNSKIVGRVIETDAHGNWIKAVCTHIEENSNNNDYSVIMREITYYE